jgi:hypothetical protein
MESGVLIFLFFMFIFIPIFKFLFFLPIFFFFKRKRNPPVFRYEWSVVRRSRPYLVSTPVGSRQVILRLSETDFQFSMILKSISIDFNLIFGILLGYVIWLNVGGNRS